MKELNFYPTDKEFEIWIEWLQNFYFFGNKHEPPFFFQNPKIQYTIQKETMVNLHEV